MMPSAPKFIEIIARFLKIMFILIYFLNMLKADMHMLIMPPILINMHSIKYNRYSLCVLLIIIKKNEISDAPASASAVAVILPMLLI